MKKLAKVLALFVFVIGFATLCTSQVEAKPKKDYVIKVNLGTNCVTVYKDGEPVKAMICSPSTKTPVGTFYTPVKYRWHEMIGNCYAQYCTRITGSILFHSVWYYRNGDKSTMSVSAYNVMGNKASHGCVRLLCEDAKWIYDNCALKTKVVIFKGKKKDDPLGRPSFTPIKTGKRMSWDPTDPDKNNPYQKAKPKITAKKIKIEYNTKTTPRKLVSIKDSLGNKLTTKNAKIKIKGKINTKKLGKYKINYTVKDKRGNKKVKTITFKVVDTKKPVFSGVVNKGGIAVSQEINLLEGITAKMVSGADVTSKITVSAVNDATGAAVAVNSGKIKFNTAGTYTVKYKVKGTNKKTKTTTAKCYVVDKHVSAAVTGARVVVDYNSQFDAFAYVKSLENYYGLALELNNRNISVAGNVDTSKAGSYLLTYTFSDGGAEYTKVIKNLTVVVKAPLGEETTTTPEEETTNGSSEETTDGEETTTEQ